MRRALVLAIALAALALPAQAVAHPLGNFTTNRYSEIQVSGNRVYVLYILDLAEIPTFQDRQKVQREAKARYGAALAERLRTGLSLRLDGRPAALRTLGDTLSFPDGVAGLQTTRLEAVYDAGAVDGRSGALTFADSNFPGRIGWRELVVNARDGARVLSSTAPARTVSDRLRAYPSDLLQSPLDVRAASVQFDPGSVEGAPPSPGSVELDAPGRGTGQGETGFAALIQEDDVGVGVILLSLLIAMFWGAAHALTPGHGKAIVAAYLVGTRGKPRHAFMLGGITTITHTLGVFALGLVTLGLSEFIVPEQLYPWLNLVSALLVVAVGITVLRFRILSFWRRRVGSAVHAHGHDHHQHHSHDHDHGHSHGNVHGHSHGGRHDHHHAPEPGSGMKGLIAVGVSGGLLPCPTALVVLLAAISLHRVGYGLLLIVAFSVGLASVITGIGLLAIGARRTFNRMSFNGPIVRALPAVSALVIVALGIAMTVRALPRV
jgi:nickel/cobalt exporter